MINTNIFPKMALLVLGVALFFLPTGILADNLSMNPKTAIENDDLSSLESMIKSGWDPDAALDARGNTALIEASRMGKLKLVEFLVDQNVSIDKFNENGLNALITSVSSKHSKIVELLLQRGANPNIQPPENKNPHLALNPPLITAVKLGALDIVKLLVSFGASVKIEDDHGKTALLTAGCNNRPSSIRFLLNQGADIDHRDDFGWSALHCAAMNGSIEALRVLMANGSDPNALTNRGFTPLMVLTRLMACEDRKACPELNKQRLQLRGWEIDYRKIARNLFINGALTNIDDERGNIPLHFIAKSGHNRLAEILLHYGSNPFIKNQIRRSPLDGALTYGRLNTYEFLVKNTYARNHRSLATRLNMALIQSVITDDFDRMKKLLRLGTNPNFETLNGWTALLKAVTKGKKNLALSLILAGANPCRANKWNQTAYDLDTKNILPADENRCKTLEALPVRFEVPGYGPLIEDIPVSEWILMDGENGLGNLLDYLIGLKGLLTEG